KNMKKLAYLLALPLAFALIYLLATEVVYAKNVKPLERKMNYGLDKPFIERTKAKDVSGYSYEKITINSPGKPIVAKLFTSEKVDTKPSNLWFYINNKLYSEAEAQKFDADFVKRLSTTSAYDMASEYDLPGIDKNGANLVFWFGKEPKLSEYTVKNRAIHQKYNGTTVAGTVVEYSYTPSGKLMDGFILKTNDGTLLKAFVEAKFAKQANAMVSKGDQITLKVYNAAYWKDNAYPVLSSFKLMKDGKVLFDRWPKTAMVLPKGSNTGNVAYAAKDSIITDQRNNMVHLYGGAHLKNNDVDSYADEIHYNFKTNSSTLVGVTDRNGNKLKQ
ncbi:MAG: hypothetical protein ACQUHE_07335, partial [Bacteroidia bacterium]